MQILINNEQREKIYYEHLSYNLSKHKAYTVFSHTNSFKNMYLPSEYELLKHNVKNVALSNSTAKNRLNSSGFLKYAIL
jgi:hypothetical protein